MMHPQHDKYGKPVRLWYKNLYEPQTVNFILASSISARVIYSTEKDPHGETVCITVPVINC